MVSNHKEMVGLSTTDVSQSVVIRQMLGEPLGLTEILNTPRRQVIGAICAD
jgi:hypothetical protein